MYNNKCADTIVIVRGFDAKYRQSYSVLTIIYQSTK